MKKILAFLLAGCLALSLTACGQEPADQTDPAEETVYPACFDGMEDLIAAARAEGALTVYGSCEESYLAAACQHFQELFGITVTYQRTAVILRHRLEAHFEEVAFYWRQIIQQPGNAVT